MVFNSTVDMVGDYTEGYGLQVTAMLATFDWGLSARDDGVNDEYYVHGAGSIVVECQYGGGVELHGDNVYTIANQWSKHTWMMMRNTTLSMVTLDPIAE